MTSVIERYHQWRKATLPASKADVAWRHSDLSGRLDEIARGVKALAMPSSAPTARRTGVAETAIALVNSMRQGKATFLQIGGNDGRLADPLHPFIEAYDWRGVIVEPVPDYFEALRQTHAARPGVTCVNVAIDVRAGRRDIYRVKPDVVRDQLMRTGEYWLQGCATFAKDVLLRSGLAESDIEPVSIRTTTGMDIVKDHALGDCDLLVVDVEGAEELVLSSFDFASWRPKAIIFESELKTEEERAAIERLLLVHRYRISWDPFDSVAVAKP
ncbi:FkbM family methyltransferase [Methylosinus sp. Sm6]|uniref:FkbM family methyltransferase n=1 Tax=Methylosinus sp. Sm6 TaxID=2866948 RepID=UPI001C994DBE|nr:FkbM family methyltransferase [Methylosinus sp. Sm6]MBY6242197.1 FkbM family methyltransferase [Methylosinus sp. Sm6]